MNINFLEKSSTKKLFYTFQLMIKKLYDINDHKTQNFKKIYIKMILPKNKKKCQIIKTEEIQHYKNIYEKNKFVYS